MVAQTWDPAPINAANTLSNGNLTATNNTAIGNDHPGYAGIIEEI